jgi:hypothetical protein
VSNFGFDTVLLLVICTLVRLMSLLKRITMWIDCDDKEAEVLAKRVPAYLASLGAVNVEVVQIADLQLQGSKE